MDKFEPMKLEDYQLDESDYDESDIEETDTQPETKNETETNSEVTVEENPTEETAPEVENPTAAENTSTQSTQTSEQNAFYAEQRRQKQLEQRIQQELERERQQAPEFQMAKLLSDMYGMPVDQLYEQLQEAAMQRQAEERGIPLEVAKQLNDYQKQQADLQQQLNLVKYQNWKSRVDSEASNIKNQFPMLSDDELEGAKVYLLDTLKNPEIPLQQAVFAMYGDKITDSLKNLAKQEAMAEISGRKKGGLPPQSMKTSDEQPLSEEERYIARMMGISEKDYVKYKS
jgi:hypothetical protein